MTTAAPPVRRVVLGADAWSVLLDAARGLDLPAPFGRDSVPALTPAQVAAAEEALRASEVVPGRTGDLLADLHPSLRASLLLHLAPGALLDVAVGRGEQVRSVRAAVTPALASLLDRTGLGPVRLSTAVTGSVTDEAAALLPGLPGALGARQDGQVRVDAVAAAAAGSARAEGRADLAAALPAGVGPVELVARFTVRGPSGASLLLCLRTPEGWHTARLAGEDLVLRPLDADRLTTDLAAALARALG